ncbi:MAG: CDP-alcohol phosphatidyltransferase family protein [Anaerolineae bacterium]|nr:CDP-alcohol phosphatidyltransferase family protein [Anaerolineae bacterium]
MANAITLSRLPLLLIAVVMLYQPSAGWRLAAAVLIVVIIALDGIDGIVARAWDEVSDLGSVLDIAVDRVVEQVLWIVYASLGLIPVWAPLIVVARGVMTDAVRAYVLGKGETAFGMMQSRWGQILVSNRPMRAIYGAAKTIAFVYLALLAAAHVAWPGTPQAQWLPVLDDIAWWLTLFVVGLTVVRGIPVFIEARRFFSRVSEVRS